MPTTRFGRSPSCRRPDVRAVCRGTRSSRYRMSLWVSERRRLQSASQTEDGSFERPTTRTTTLSRWIRSTRSSTSCSSHQTRSTLSASASRIHVDNERFLPSVRCSLIGRLLPTLADPNALPPLATGIFTPSNGAAVWDLGHSLNDPTGELKSFTQLEGPPTSFSHGASRASRSSAAGAACSKATADGRSWLGRLPRLDDGPSRVKAGREWWAQGFKSLIDSGVDSMGKSVAFPPAAANTAR